MENKSEERVPLGALIVIFVVVAVIGSFLTWALFTKSETVEPGYELVIVDKPYFFGGEGVRKSPLSAGRVMLWKTSSVVPVRVTPQSIPVKFDDYSSSDNILLDFESTIQFRVLDSVRMIEAFGEDWFSNNVERQYTSLVREAIKKKTMTEMMSDSASAVAVDNEVTTALTKLIADAKLPVEVLGVSLGRAKPNSNVLEQMNMTAAEQQRRRTLIAATEAEKEREQEQIKKAVADNAYRNAMGLSPEMFIQLEQIKRYAEACARSTSCFVVSGQTPLVVHPGK